MGKRTRIARLLDIRPESHAIHGEQVEVNLITGGKTELLLLERGFPDVDIGAWIKEHSDLVTAGLRTQGAILFRNFNLVSPLDFANIFSVLNGKPLPYIQRTSPRTEIDAESRIYTATDYPKEQVINMHNESSYAKEWPMRIGFYCLTAPEKGGETPLADVRKIYQLLSNNTLRRFKENGILYVRNIHPRLGLSWQEVYQTEEKSKVVDFCVKNGYEFNWGSDDLLTLKWGKKAIERHPETGEHLWFNHVFFYNYLSTPGQLYSSLPLEEIPFQCYYGNGKPIEQEVILEIWSKFEEVKMTYSWQKNDFLLLDNMLVAHGRMPFSGDRKILVSMAQAYQSDDDGLNDSIKGSHGQ